jgi:ABC-type nickel/cobalt efflux system permease component RcnA
MIATPAALALGLVVGARHAFEPDHLAAVSTLVGDARRPASLRGAFGLGALWGLGHTIALLVVGVALIALDNVMPARLGVAFELIVAAMLVLLGARAIVIGLRNREGHAPTHRHGHVHHAHGGADAHVHVGTRALAWRPLTIGLVHGLAGSGALTALAFAELPSAGARVLYMVMFGAGSIGGMAIATGLTGAALQRVAHERRTRRAFSLATGALSCVVGVVWALPLLG